jgi:zinc ribbon protein
LLQSSARFCSQCSSPLEPGQRFCTNCGATTSIESNVPTALTSDQTILASGTAQSTPVIAQTTPVVNSSATGPTIITPNESTPGSAVNMPGSTPATPQAATPYVSGAMYSTAPASGNQFYAQDTYADVIPPPPPPDSFISTPQEAPAAPYYMPPTPASKTVPTYARAPKRSRGCLIASIVLLLVLVLGGVGAIYAFRSRTASNNSNTNGQQSTPSGSGTTTGSSNTTPGSGVTTTPGSSGNTPTTSGPVTIPLNLKFTYASVDTTLLSVQQTNSFPDDSSTPQGGVRVSLSESNATTGGANFLYSDVVRLVLPGGSITAPSNAKSFEGPAAGVSRNNWIDFAITNQNIDLSKLILRYGTATENQMDIPLTPNADLSKYQPKTITPNATFQYAGMNWTLTSVTESLSANGQQAATGMVFVTATLKAVNSSASAFRGYPGDYMRLQSGDNKSAPTSSVTFPLSVESQSTGTGVVPFSTAQGGTSFTLLLLAQQSSPPINAVSVTFQIQ